MSSYLGQYGAGEEKRNRLIKRIVLSVLAVTVVGTIAYYSLRTRGQERAMDQFLETLKSKDYQTAYRMWGCTPETPCRYYDRTKFDEDWGPESRYPDAAKFQIQNEDFCDVGVVFAMSYPGAEDVSLWVERSTNVISFSPWPRCPGRHLQLGSFFRRIFSRS